MAENLKKITKMPRLCCKKQGWGLYMLCKYAPHAGGNTPAARYGSKKTGRCRLQCAITTIRSNQTTLSAVKLPLLL